MIKQIEHKIEKQESDLAECQSKLTLLKEKLKQVKDESQYNTLNAEIEEIHNRIGFFNTSIPNLMQELKDEVKANNLAKERLAQLQKEQSKLIEDIKKHNNSYTTIAESLIEFLTKQKGLYERNEKICESIYELGGESLPTPEESISKQGHVETVEHEIQVIGKRYNEEGLAIGDRTYQPSATHTYHNGYEKLPAYKTISIPAPVDEPPLYLPEGLEDQSIIKV